MINYLKTLLKSKFFNTKPSVTVKLAPEATSTVIYVDLDNILGTLPESQATWCRENLNCFLFHIASNYPKSLMRVYGNLAHWGWTPQVWSFKGRTIELIDTPPVSNYGKTLCDSFIMVDMLERAKANDLVVLVSSDVDFSIALSSLKNKKVRTELILFSHCSYLLKQSVDRYLNAKSHYQLDELVKCHIQLTGYLAKLSQDQVPLPSIAHFLSKVRSQGDQGWFGHKSFANFISLLNTGWYVDNNCYKRANSR